jgi:hypothetical protein
VQGAAGRRRRVCVGRQRALVFDRRRVCLKCRPYEMKQTITILLTLFLLGANSAIPAALCGSVSERSVAAASKHCKMSQATAPSPMSCCRPASQSQSQTVSKASPACCHVSLPLPNHSRPALPGSSSHELRSQIQLQAFELVLCSLPFQTLLSSSGVPAISFRLDRSDTYLQSSSLRI